MNVCLLCRQYPPADGGGIGTYMSRYARALARQGCCVTVVTAATGRHPGSTPVATDASGITIVEIPVPIDERWTAPTADATDAHCAAFHVLSPASLFGMAVARCLPALHDRHGFDIVESPETGAALWFALNERRTSRAWPASPVFVTHVFSPSAWIEEQNRCPATSRGELALRWMEADAARWSDARVCSSRALADWAERAWDLAPGDIDLFPPPMGEASESPTTPAAGRRLLYVGRLEPRKGVDVLLASFARAGSHIDDLHLELAGHDMTDPRTNQPFGRRSVELHVPASLRRRVHLLGHLDHRVLAQARRRARAAVIPATCDNYPYACIEAMAAGLPVIAARAGGVASLVRHGREGLLFDPGDIDACADAIVELARMDAPRRSEMGKAAADRVRSVCDDRAVANARLDHYARLIDRRPSAPARSDIPVVVLNAPAAHRGELEPLVAAVQGGLDFAHGWARSPHPPGIIASPTPTLDSIAVFPGPIGPLAVSTDALERLGEHDAIESRRCHDPLALIRRMICLGLNGAVVPSVHEPANPLVDPGCADPLRADDALAPTFAAWAVASGNPPPHRRGMTWQQRAEAAEAELDHLRAGRAWRVASALSTLAHALPTHRQGR